MNKYRTELEGMLKAAFDTLYKNDEYLITHKPCDLSGGKDGHVSERGIVARLAIYLQEWLNKSKTLADHHLDVEYNRNMDKPKYLPETDWKDNGAYPDLIIHKRQSNDDNILVVEFKTYWNNSKEGMMKDIVKLHAFQKEPYFYENALFVLLHWDEPQWIWVDESTSYEDLGGGEDE